LDKATGEITRVALWDNKIEVDWGRIVAQELATLLDTGILKEIVSSIPSAQRHNRKVINAIVRHHLMTVSLSSLTETSDLPRELWGPFEQALREGLFEGLVEEVQELLEEREEEG